MEQVDASAVPDVLDVLDEVESEVAASASVGGQMAVNVERMKTLTARLRAAVAYAREHPVTPAERQAMIKQAEAQAALVLEEARRKADMLLDGTRVKQLREEHVQSIIAESRQRGERLVADAYGYGRQRMQEVIVRAEEARHHVSLAAEAVRTEPEGAGRRLADVAKQLVAGRGGVLSSMISRLFPS